MAAEKAKKRRRDGSIEASTSDLDPDAARREAKKQRKEAKRRAREAEGNAAEDEEQRRSAKRARKEAKRRSLASSAADDSRRDDGEADTTLGKAERKALKKQQRKEEKRKANKGASGASEAALSSQVGHSSASASPPATAVRSPPPASAGFNPFASQPSQASASDNPFAAASSARGTSDGKRKEAANSFPPGFDFEATQRHLQRKQTAGPLSAEDKSLLQSIERHTSSPGYMAPVRRVFKQTSTPEGSSKARISEASGTTRISAKRSAARISSSKELTVIDATGLSDAECLAEKQYTSKQLKWLQEERQDFKIRWGRFGKEEAEAIEKRLNEWEAENDLDRETTQSLLFEREKRDAEAYVGLIKALTYSVPYRSFDTVRRYVREHYNPLSRQGAWTEDEVRKLREAVDKYGTDWAKASVLVGRSRAACRLFMRDQGNKLEPFGGVKKGGGSTTPGSRTGREDDQVESDVEESMSPPKGQSQSQGQGEDQASRRKWTKEEIEELRQAVSSLAGTPQAKGREPSDARFPWKLVAERMSSNRPANKIRQKWQSLISHEARLDVDASQDVEAAPPARYVYQRDDYLFVKILGRAKEALEFDDIKAIDWASVAKDMPFPHDRLRMMYTSMVKRYLGERSIDAPFKAVLAELKAPTKRAREAYLLEEELRPGVKAEKERMKSRSKRESRSLSKEAAGGEGAEQVGQSSARKRAQRKSRVDEDLIDSDEER